MEGFFSVDTLYFTVKYPHADIFNKWNLYVEGVDHRKLKQGIPVNDFLITTGASGYKISLRRHDARVFLTPDVDDKRGEGKGMGIWVQLGPKYLAENFNRLQSSVWSLLREIGLKGKYPTRITRVDLALDLFGVSMQEQNLDDWKQGWVGRSKVSAQYFNSRTGDLETINIGSRKSSVFLRVYDKIAQSIKDDDLFFWFEVWKQKPEKVTRIEWEVKPNKGNFDNTVLDFSTFAGFTAYELMNYLLDWGRLCVPIENDTNRNRWPESELWKQARKVATQWTHDLGKVSRVKQDVKPWSEAYATQLVGMIAGGMARSNPDVPNIEDVFHKLQQMGFGYNTITQKAYEKATVLKLL